MRNMLYVSLVLSILVWFFNNLAIKHSLFWVFWWYDIPMHFFGGVALGLLSVWFFGSLRERFNNFSFFSLAVYTLTSVFVIGIAWEIFEYRVDIYYNPFVNYALDTVKDLVMDLLGGAVALWWYAKSKVSFSKTI